MASDFVSSVLIDGQNSFADFYNNRHLEHSTDSYNRVCNIYTTLLAGTKFYYEEKDGLAFLFKEKKLSLFLRNSLNFIQKHTADKKTGIVGYLCFLHDDVRSKEDPLGAFTSFEIDPVPIKALDRHPSRVVELYDFRDVDARASLVRACHAYDEELWNLRKTAHQASKLIAKNKKLNSSFWLSSLFSRTEQKQQEESLRKLGTNQFFTIGKEEEISAVSMAIEPALRSYETAKEDMSFKSGIDPQFLNFQAGDTSKISEDSMLALEIANYRQVCLVPLINKILQIGGLKSDWHFAEENAKEEKERADSEEKYMDTFKKMVETTEAILANEKIRPDIKKKSQDLLAQFLKITAEIKN